MQENLIILPAIMTKQSSSDLEHAGASFTSVFLGRMHPPLPEADLAKYRDLVLKHEIQVGDLAVLGVDGLQQLGISNLVHAARIAAAAQGDVRSDPPKVDGKPVEVQAKVGIISFGRVDTVSQSAYVRFFFDLHWIDPSMIGADPANVPPYLWRPDAYVFNATGDYNKTVHPATLLDPERGLMLQALEFEATFDNPMDLRDFPFDSDAATIHVIAVEEQSAEDYVLRPWSEGEANATKLFFDPEFVAEWTIRGHSIDGYELMGGNSIPYSHMLIHLHLQRRSSFYLWKLVLPLFLSTVFCFSSFFFEPDNLSDRNATSLTMFLATAALLFVIGSLLPKTSFLTRIDKFVIVSLLVQFVVAVLSWVIAGGFGDIASHRVDNIDRYGLIFLPTFYFMATLFYFAPPLVQHLLLSPTDRPEYPMTHFHDDKVELGFYPFVMFENIFL
ncbi:uncharacterized protein MONBRDRAFT_39352 [Monosiga brevicollis MX1]|uniref:Neurotransmitter-gated ion-channel ligand-binding domain-containing protein n=1 Tax=Monosiga brevicollis TaxID=81824 RepID=A9VE08_MONBE|nr:uncharacterized protein MONBRDRAFT_39352 [Monosiga brevicollis MX1]EDQ84226.1 predicted protein [Monosiga brevicollis MX1]|eukprot:XP_001750950.1 hypothetical protein [Monosiga brevicollis MX1]